MREESAGSLGIIKALLAIGFNNANLIKADFHIAVALAGAYI